MKKKLSLFLLCLFFFNSYSQDFHYSQFYNSPLTLNPALTGMTEGSFRVGGIYRNQWWNTSGNFINTAFSTPSLSFDAPIFLNNSAIGLGIVLLNDRVAAGLLNDFTALGSFSYILGLGSNQDHLLSFGVQGNYTNRSFSNNLEFASQFQDNEFNSSYGNPEALEGNTFHHFDANAGIAYLFKITEDIKFNAGFSAFNIIATDNSALTGSNKSKYRRYSGQLGADIGFTSKMAILPSILFMQQNNVNQLNAGLAFAYKFNTDLRMYLGAYNRSNGWVNDLQMDAIIAYAAMDIKNFKVGLSYDFTISELQNVPNNTSAIELSLLYIHKKKEKEIPALNLFCPRF